MISFVLSLVALILGYLFYGRFVEHVFALTTVLLLLLPKLMVSTLWCFLIGRFS